MCQSINFNCSRSSVWMAERRVEIPEGEKMPLKLIPFYYYRRAISTLCLILKTKIFSTKLIETTQKLFSRTQHTNRRENANTMEIFHKTKFSFVFIFRTEILWSSITGMLDCLNRWRFRDSRDFFSSHFIFCSRLWSLVLVNRENLILPCCAPIRRL